MNSIPPGIIQNIIQYGIYMYVQQLNFPLFHFWVVVIHVIHVHSASPDFLKIDSLN